MTSNLPELRQPRSPGKSRATVPLRLVQLLEDLEKIDLKDRRAIAWRVTREKGDLLRYYAVRYVRSALTDYREAVRKRFGPDHPAVGYLRLSDRDQDAVNTLDRTQVRLRHTTLRPIDSEALVDAAVEMLQSGRHATISVGLCLLTGRRPAELYCTGELLPFSAAGANTPNPFSLDDENSVLFAGADGRVSGQAKRRDAPTSRQEPFLIPVLANADLIVSAFQELRNQKSFAAPEQVNPSVAKAQSDAVVRYRLEDAAHRRLMVKDLRAAYAQIAYEHFHPPTFTIGAFFREVLGHAEDETSTLSYFKFYSLDHAGDTLAAIERYKSDLLASLIELQRSQSDEERRLLIEQRVSALEGAMQASSIVSARQRIGADVDEAARSRALEVRRLVGELSPAQMNLLRAVANGAGVPSDRRPLRILEDRGLLETIVVDNMASVTLTELGQEVRDNLPGEAPEATPPPPVVFGGTDPRGALEKYGV